MTGTTQEDIYSRVPMFGPCMDRHMGFSEQDHTGDALSFPEMMKVKTDHRRTGALSRASQGNLYQGRIIQHGASVEIR